MSTASETSTVPSEPVLQQPGFDFQPRTRVVFGCGTFARLGELSCGLGTSRALLVTDAGLKHAGHSQRAVELLQAAGVDVHVYDEVSPNPTTDDVDQCVAFARDKNIDLIIGLGGGSSLDCAKGANFLLTNGGRMHDYRGVGKATKEMLPMIAVPTTSGTGSEAQSFAVIADAETHMKMPCGDVKAACRIAILDPELTVTMPRAVAAATGIDAMTHAIESYVTKKRTAVSRMFSREAWSLLSSSFETTLDEPGNLQARGSMQWGAHLAGAAIENSMLGAAHAAANPISAHFQTTHGIAVGLMLPHVIRWNRDHVGTSYCDLVMAAGWGTSKLTAETAADLLAEGFTRLLTAASQPIFLDKAVSSPLTEETLQRLAEEAAQQWTGTFNPRTMNQESFLSLYRNALTNADR